MTARHRGRPRHMRPLSGRLHARRRPRADGASLLGAPSRNVQYAQGRRSRTAGAGARPRAPIDAARRLDRGRRDWCLVLGSFAAVSSLGPVRLHRSDARILNLVLYRVQPLLGARRATAAVYFGPDGWRLACVGSPEITCNRGPLFWPISASSASLSQVRAMSIRMACTLEFGARSAICRVAVEGRKHPDPPDARRGPVFPERRSSDFR
jgi:hypothetical protein